MLTHPTSTLGILSVDRNTFGGLLGVPVMPLCFHRMLLDPLWNVSDHFWWIPGVPRDDFWSPLPSFVDPCCSEVGEVRAPAHPNREIVFALVRACVRAGGRAGDQ